MTCPARPPSPPRSLLSKPRAPRPKTLRPLHTLDKLTHFLPQLSNFVPFKNGSNSFRAHTDLHHLVDPGANYTTVVPRGNRHTAIRAIGASHTACKYEFRQNIRSHSLIECILTFILDLILKKLKYTPAVRSNIIIKMKIHSSCEIEYFVETHLCKLCVILRSRVFLQYQFRIIYAYSIIIPCT